MDFNDKAADWDNDPQKIERAGAFMHEVDSFLLGEEINDALEFGCGTGLLSFFFRERFKRITLVDSSSGMLRVVREKIKKNHLDHFKPVHIDLEKQELNEKFDIIYTLMALHHVRDLDLIFHRFNDMLAEGGYLCIGDLEKEDGSFHSHLPDFDGHNGFEGDKLERLLKLHGFSILEFKDFYTIEKGNGTDQQTYPLFMLIAQKPEFRPHEA